MGPSKLVLPRAESMMKFAELEPPPGRAWSYTEFNFDTDPERLERAGKELNALNPDLMPLKKRGGKIVQHSGWADLQVNPMRGTSHCNGGPGCSSVDWRRGRQRAQKLISSGVVEGLKNKAKVTRRKSYAFAPIAS